MDAKRFNEGLADLRTVRDEVKKAEIALQKLHNTRDRKIKALASYEKAKPERLAPAAGLSVKDIVRLAPHLAPQPPVGAQPAVPESKTAQTATADAAPQGTIAPAMNPVPLHAPSALTTESVETNSADSAATEAPESATEAETRTELQTAAEAAPAAPADSPVPGPVERELPTIPDGAAGQKWLTVAPGLLSVHPNFTQAVRPSAFLDASTGVLVYRDRRFHVDVGHASADEILTAVFAFTPESVQRIYITAGAPWHRESDRHPYLRDAVRAWLEAPMPSGWKVETQRGKDSMAGHHIHERNPVGRWQRGNQHVEIRNVAEWFDPDGADVATIRQAFVLALDALKREWDDVVLMGSPMQTGRDLWTRTIPTKRGSRWADGYPVMSDEIRQLMHATSGQGRTELIAPPRVPEQLPQLVELDRTLAYGKHTWAAGVGAPERITPHKFASWTEKEQTDALFAPSHWHVRVTIPDNWNHVGLLPAAIEGDRAWHYPHEAGRTFTTWAGGAEINLALRNPIQPWKVEILDGLLWESGQPLKDWADKLKKVWAGLADTAKQAGTEELRQAYRLASRAVRSILLYGIGGFAQRPVTTTGTVPIGSENQIPKGARVKTMSHDTVTWERSVMSRNPNAHPEWSAGVYSAARAALLSTRAKTADGHDTHVGALHLPAGSIVAFRTDAIYTTVMPQWPYNGKPGDYLLKGHLPYPITAPTNEAEFYTHQSLGRVLLQETQGQL